MRAARQRTTIFVTALAVLLSVIQVPPPAWGLPLLGLPEPGARVALSPAYRPAVLAGLTVHKNDPFRFDFILDPGEQALTGPVAASEGQRLIRYFMAALAVSAKDTWVNLSPYEGRRVVPSALGMTELGRDLLAQDYLLKQISASLLDPDGALGRDFWRSVYGQSKKALGTTNVAVSALNKVWITVDQAQVTERGQTVFVVSCHLKVMLEEDYLAAARQGQKSGNDEAALAMRRLILPALEREVNEGKNFAPLRQICHSILLAGWYKKRLRDSLLNELYANRAIVRGIDVADTSFKESIYRRYLEAYKKGVLNFIREEETPDGGAVPRKYFSGGFAVSGALENPAMVSAAPADHAAVKVGVRLSLEVPPDQTSIPKVPTSRDLPATFRPTFRGILLVPNQIWRTRPLGAKVGSVELKIVAITPPSGNAEATVSFFSNGDTTSQSVSLSVFKSRLTRATQLETPTGSTIDLLGTTSRTDQAQLAEEDIRQGAKGLGSDIEIKGQRVVAGQDWKWKDSGTGRIVRIHINNVTGPTDPEGVKVQFTLDRGKEQSMRPGIFQELMERASLVDPSASTRKTRTSTPTIGTAGAQPAPQPWRVNGVELRRYQEWERIYVHPDSRTPVRVHLVIKSLPPVQDQMDGLMVAVVWNGNPREFTMTSLLRGLQRFTLITPTLPARYAAFLDAFKSTLAMTGITTADQLYEVLKEDRTAAAELSLQTLNRFLNGISMMDNKRFKLVREALRRSGTISPAEEESLMQKFFQHVFPLTLNGLKAGWRSDVFRPSSEQAWQTLYEEIAKIAFLRHVKGWSQEEMAPFLGMTYAPAVSAMEKGTPAEKYADIAAAIKTVLRMATIKNPRYFERGVEMSIANIRGEDVPTAANRDDAQLAAEPPTLGVGQVWILPRQRHIENGARVTVLRINSSDDGTDDRHIAFDMNGKELELPEFIFLDLIATASQEGSEGKGAERVRARRTRRADVPWPTQRPVAAHPARPLGSPQAFLAALKPLLQTSDAESLARRYLDGSEVMPVHVLKTLRDAMRETGMTLAQEEGLIQTYMDIVFTVTQQELAQGWPSAAARGPEAAAEEYAKIRKLVYARLVMGLNPEDMIPDFGEVFVAKLKRLEDGRLPLWYVNRPEVMLEYFANRMQVAHSYFEPQAEMTIQAMWGDRAEELLKAPNPRVKYRADQNPIYSEFLETFKSLLVGAGIESREKFSEAFKKAVSKVERAEVPRVWPDLNQYWDGLISIWPSRFHQIRYYLLNSGIISPAQEEFLVQAYFKMETEEFLTDLIEDVPQWTMPEQRLKDIDMIKRLLFVQILHGENRNTMITWMGLSPEMVRDILGRGKLSPLFQKRDRERVLNQFMEQAGIYNPGYFNDPTVEMTAANVRGSGFWELRFRLKAAETDHAQLADEGEDKDGEGVPRIEVNDVRLATGQKWVGPLVLPKQKFENAAIIIGFIGKKRDPKDHRQMRTMVNITVIPFAGQAGVQLDREPEWVKEKLEKMTLAPPLPVYKPSPNTNTGRATDNPRYKAFYDRLMEMVKNNKDIKGPSDILETLNDKSDRRWASSEHWIGKSKFSPANFQKLREDFLAAGIIEEPQEEELMALYFDQDSGELFETLYREAEELKNPPKQGETEEARLKREELYRKRIIEIDFARKVRFAQLYFADNQATVADWIGQSASIPRVKVLLNEGRVWSTFWTNRENILRRFMRAKEIANPDYVKVGTIPTIALIRHKADQDVTNDSAQTSAGPYTSSPATTDQAQRAAAVPVVEVNGTRISVNQKWFAGEGNGMPKTIVIKAVTLARGAGGEVRPSIMASIDGSPSILTEVQLKEKLTHMHLQDHAGEGEARRKAAAEDRGPAYVAFYTLLKEILHDNGIGTLEEFKAALAKGRNFKEPAQNWGQAWGYWSGQIPIGQDVFLAMWKVLQRAKALKPDERDALVKAFFAHVHGDRLKGWRDKISDYPEDQREQRAADIDMIEKILYVMFVKALSQEKVWPLLGMANKSAAAELLSKGILDRGFQEDRRPQRLQSFIRQADIANEALFDKPFSELGVADVIKGIDSAQVSDDPLAPGGIDLNTDKTAWSGLDPQGGAQVGVDAATIARLRASGIQSLRPEILSITPVKSMLSLAE